LSCCKAIVLMFCLGHFTQLIWLIPFMPPKMWRPWHRQSLLWWLLIVHGVNIIIIHHIYGYT
jgi:hypothetical protein